MSDTQNLVRANKCTAYWGGNGVAIGNFYKTHDKVCMIRSDDDSVVQAGFTMPESTEENPVTAQDKLASFKNFIMTNATAFGIQYDPVDRRPKDYQFPHTYHEDAFKEFSYKMAVAVLTDVMAKVQASVIDKLVKGGHKPEGTQVDFGIEDTPYSLDITESYKNGNLKYAIAKYNIIMQVAVIDANGATIEPVQIKSTINVELVSGQIKKPRKFGDDISLTAVGIKQFLIDNGAIPQIEKPKKEEEEVVEDDSEVVPVGQGADDPDNETNDEA